MKKSKFIDILIEERDRLLNPMPWSADGDVRNDALRRFASNVEDRLYRVDEAVAMPEAAEAHLTVPEVQGSFVAPKLTDRCYNCPCQRLDHHVEQENGCDCVPGSENYGTCEQCRSCPGWAEKPHIKVGVDLSALGCLCSTCIGRKAGRA